MNRVMLCDLLLLPNWATGELLVVQAALLPTDNKFNQ